MLNVYLSAPKAQIVIFMCPSTRLTGLSLAFYESYVSSELHPQPQRAVLRFCSLRDVINLHRLAKLILYLQGPAGKFPVP